MRGCDPCFRGHFLLFTFDFLIYTHNSDFSLKNVYNLISLF